MFTEYTDVWRNRRGYVVMNYEIRASPTRIEAKASRRLSYNGEQDDAYRGELAGHIAKLRVCDDEILHAVYCGPDDHFDIENILFYNVRFPEGGRRSSCFSHAARNGVSFAYKKQAERLTVYEANPTRAIYEHEHLLVDQGAIPIGGVNSNTKPWQVWVWINEWQDQKDMKSTSWHDRRFEMEVTLGGVEGNFAAFVKPVFDGVISAFHDSAEVPSNLALRIANQTGTDEKTVRRWLNRAGPIRISDEPPVYQRSKGVQWSPDDHLCIRGIIRPECSRSRVMRIRVWSAEKNTDRLVWNVTILNLESSSWFVRSENYC